MPSVTPCSARPGRRAATLVELVVAVALAALLFALGGAALVSVERRQREGSARGAGRRAVRETIAVLSEDLRGVDSLALRGDTAVDLLAMVGTSVVCARTADAVVLPPETADGGLPFTSWRAVAGAADVVAIFDAGAAQWWYAAADSVADAPMNGCLPATGFVSASDSTNRLRSVRLRLDRTLPAGIDAGAPVRVLRRGRYLLHRGADGSWELAYRRCSDLLLCAATQPVTGPLAPLTERGLTFKRSVDGVLLVVAVHAPRRAGGVPGDSLLGTMVVGRAP